MDESGNRAPAATKPPSPTKAAAAEKSAKSPHRMLKTKARNTPKPPGRRPSPRRKKAPQAPTEAASSSPAKGQAQAQAEPSPAQKEGVPGTAPQKTPSMAMLEKFRSTSDPSLARKRGSDPSVSKVKRRKSKSILARTGLRRSGRKSRSSSRKTTSSSSSDVKGDAAMKPARAPNASRFSQKAGSKNWRKLRRSLRRSREKIQSTIGNLNKEKVSALLGELGLHEEDDRSTLADFILAEHGSADGQISPYELAKQLLAHGEAASKSSKSQSARGRGIHLAQQLSRTKLTSLRQAFNLAENDTTPSSPTPNDEELSGVGEEADTDFYRRSRKSRQSIQVNAEDIEAMQTEISTLAAANEALQRTLETKTLDFKAQLAEAQESAQVYLDQTASQLDASQEQLKGVRTQLRGVQHTKDSLEEEVAALREEIAKLEQSKHQSREAELAAELEDARLDITRLEQLNDEMQTQFPDLEGPATKDPEQESGGAGASKGKLRSAPVVIKQLQDELAECQAIKAEEVAYLQQSNEELRQQLEEANSRQMEASEQQEHRMRRRESLGAEIASTMAHSPFSGKPITVNSAVQTDPVDGEPAAPAPAPAALPMLARLAEEDAGFGSPGPQDGKKKGPPVAARKRAQSTPTPRGDSHTARALAMVRSTTEAVPVGPGFVAKRAESLQHPVADKAATQVTTPTREQMVEKPHMTSLYQTTVKQSKEIAKLKERLKMDTTQLRADNQRLSLDAERLRDRNSNLLEEIQAMSQRLAGESARAEGQERLLDELKDPLAKMETRIEDLVKACQDTDTQMTAHERTVAEKLGNTVVMRDLAEANAILHEKYSSLMSQFKSTASAAADTATAPASLNESICEMQDSAKEMEVVLNLQRQLMATMLGDGADATFLNVASAVASPASARPRDGAPSPSPSLTRKQPLSVGSRSPTTPTRSPTIMDPPRPALRFVKQPSVPEFTGQKPRVSRASISVPMPQGLGQGGEEEEAVEPMTAENSRVGSMEQLRKQQRSPQPRRASMAPSAVGTISEEEPSDDAVLSTRELEGLRRMSSYQGRRLSKMGSLEVMLLPNEGHILPGAADPEAAAAAGVNAPQPPTLQVGGVGMKRGRSTGIQELERAIAIGDRIAKQLAAFSRSSNADAASLAADLEKDTALLRAGETVRESERNGQKTPAPRASLQWDMFDLDDGEPGSGGDTKACFKGEFTQLQGSALAQAGSTPPVAAPVPVKPVPTAAATATTAATGVSADAVQAKATDSSFPLRPRGKSLSDAQSVSMPSLASAAVTEDLSGADRRDSRSVRNSEVFFSPPPRHFAGSPLRSASASLQRDTPTSPLQPLDTLNLAGQSLAECAPSSDAGEPTAWAEVASTVGDEESTAAEEEEEDEDVFVDALPTQTRSRGSSPSRTRKMRRSTPIFSSTSPRKMQAPGLMAFAEAEEEEETEA